MTEIRQNKQIRYRVPTINDIRELFRIERDCFKSYYQTHRFTEKQFNYYVRNPLSICIIAILNGEIVGYVLGISQQGRLRHIVRLYSIAVLEHERQMGTGSGLLRRFIKETKKRGANVVSLEVAKANMSAKRFFLKAGFYETGSMPDYYGKGYHGIRMKRLV